MHAYNVAGLPFREQTKLAKALIDRGWVIASNVMDTVQALADGALDDTVKKYQKFFKLSDADTLQHMTAPRMCARPDIEHATARPLPSAEVLWYCNSFNLPGGLTWDDFGKMIERQWARLGEVCGITAKNVATPDEANTIIDCDRIDGELGTLAWAELANGDPRMIAHMMIDSGDTWVWQNGILRPSNRIDIGRVFLHEAIHRLGLPHDTRGLGALMDPTYSLEIDDVTEYDVERLQALYPRTKTTKPVGGDTPAKPPVPPPDKDVFTLNGVTVVQGPGGVTIQFPGVRISPIGSK